jgi:hypothetical protein
MKHLLLTLLVLAVLPSCSPKSTQSRGWSRTDENGYVYSYSKVVINNSNLALFVISKTSPEMIKDQPIWTSSTEGYELYGQSVVHGETPTLYYGQDGIVRNTPISDTGIYRSLFEDGGPTISEIESIITHHQAL